MDEATLKILDAAIKLKREELGHTQGGRDPYAEAAMDMRSYSSDPYSRQRLEQNKGGASMASHPAWPPRNVFVRPEGDGQWIVEADGRLFGPCPNALEAENQMRKHYG
jgi:hypothetical protein